MIVVPTLNRTGLLKNFVESVISTAPEVSGLILVDEKDFEANRPGYAEVDSALERLPRWKIRITKGISMGDKCREIWPEVKEEKWLGLLNDDHYCVTPEWDKKVEAFLDGTNMVSTNDGNWNFGMRVVGLTAWSMGLLDAVGFPIFPRNLQHLYIDDVWKAIGDKTGCWLETIKVNIEHRHVYCGKSPQDETFKKVNAPGSWEYDAKEFKHFMEQDFKAVCERVDALRTKQQALEKFT